MKKTLQETEAHHTTLEAAVKAYGYSVTTLLII